MNNTIAFQRPMLFMNIRLLPLVTTPKGGGGSKYVTKGSVAEYIAKHAIIAGWGGGGGGAGNYPRTPWKKIPDSPGILLWNYLLTKDCLMKKQ